MVKTAVLVSGGGTNLQAIIDAYLLGELPDCELAAVISSEADVFALTRAENAKIPSYVVERKIFPNRRSFTEAILGKLKDLDIELVVFAGFMYVMDPVLINTFKNRIINVHPALIPAFCGDGYYGLKVHEKALEYGVKVTGATVHFVTEDTDAGPIILQHPVAIEEGDTPKTLQRRVMEQAEWIILPRAISLYCRGLLQVEGRTVHIRKEDGR